MDYIPVIGGYIRNIMGEKGMLATHCLKVPPYVLKSEYGHRVLFRELRVHKSLCHV